MTTKFLIVLSVTKRIWSTFDSCRKFMEFTCRLSSQSDKEIRAGHVEFIEKFRVRPKNSKYNFSLFLFLCPCQNIQSSQHLENFAWR